MLTQEITCPYCAFEFQATVWVDGSCEKCSGNYYWSMEFKEDLTDGWHIIEWDRKRSIYIASTLSNWKRIRSFVECFKKIGIPIAYDWTVFGEEIFASDMPRDIDPTSLCEKALCEYDGVASASYMLVVMPAGCGTNFEFGAAYQRFKKTNNPKITILDETEPTAPVSFHYLPGVQRMDNVREVIVDILQHFDINIKNINIDQLGSQIC